MASRMPTLFLGHGNPMNAVLENDFTRGWRAIGESLPRPTAVLCVSAHWYLPGVAVTAMDKPRTIHDFGGFPRELYTVEYLCPGSASLAERVAELLEPVPVMMDDSWGLDHGTWSVLCHVFPQADIPIVQLSIDDTQPAAFHYELGRRLAPLRDEGVLIAGSGNVVHNLHTYAWGRNEVEPFEWAVSFEAALRDLVTRHDHSPLVEYESLGRAAHLSVPTPDHYLPLLYVLGASDENDNADFPVEGVDGGSISMVSIRLGLERE